MRGSRTVPVGLVGRPLAAWPFSFRSMCQLSVSPALFLRVKAKTALPCLIASFRSASLELRAALMASKAAEEGNLSARDTSQHAGPEEGVAQSELGVRPRGLSALPLARVIVASGGVACFHDVVIRGLAVESVEGKRKVRYRLLRWQWRGIDNQQASHKGGMRSSCRAGALMRWGSLGKRLHAYIGTYLGRHVP